MFALADCNNFYASCQRVFQPELEHQPVVVLSNNDGCIIARSNEAKALGIPMGAPTYQWQGFLKHHKVHVFSSNYALYGDMSARVMNSLARFHPDIEIYSIDEAFLYLDGIAREQLADHAQELSQTVRQWTGIPLSVGVAPTKTLAKLANHLCKKQDTPQQSFVIPSARDAFPILSQVPVGSVWGIGRNWAEKLRAEHILTAADLANADPQWIRRRYNVVLQRTAMELRGTPCIEIEQLPERKQILVSRSFRPKVSDERTLRELLAGYISRAAEKLRSQHSLTRNLTVFAHTKPGKTGFYSNIKSINLSQYTADTATLIRAGRWGLRQIYQPGLEYYKAGIMLNDLSPDKNQQMSLFAPAQYDNQARQRMQLLDQVNQRFGAETLKFASQSQNRWKMHQQHLSPAYTTRWDELLEVC